MTSCGTSSQLERIAAGDRDAAGDLIRRYEVPLRAAIRRRLGPELRARVDTDDIFQETALAAVRALPGFRYRGSRALRAWLASLAEREIQAAARRYRSGKRNVRKDRPPEVLARMPSPVTSVSRAAERDELTESLRASVARLPEPDRTVLLLHSFRERSFRSIAEDLGMTDWSAARRVFQRALKSLGDQLAF